MIEHFASALPRLLLGVALGVGVVLATVYWAQRRLQYFPDPSSPPLPKPEANAGLENIALRAADGVELSAWYWPAAGEPTVLVFHGNAGHRGDRLDLVRALHDLGLGVFALDYRGYGGSSGRPTERGLYEDAEAAVRWLKGRGQTDLIYFGESLGTGVAVELANRRPPKALILEAAFDSAVAIGQRAYPFLPVSWLMTDRFQSDEKIHEVQAPLLMLHGSEDEIIPIEHARALYERANEPKRFVEIADAGHNDLRLDRERYFAALTGFLRDTLGDSRPSSTGHDD